MKPEPTKTKNIRANFAMALKRRINIFTKNVFPKILILISQNKSKLGKAKTYSEREIVQRSAITEITAIINIYEYNDIRRELRPVLSRYTRQAYNKGIDKAINDINKIIDFDIERGIRPIDFEAVEVLIDNNFILVSNTTTYMKKEMLRVISVGMLEGQSNAKIAKAIRERINISKHRAVTIARTETIRAYNTANINKYKENGIKTWRWLTAADERTCSQCEPLDGHIFDIGEAQPPIHVQCRCTITPYIDEDRTPLKG